VVHWDQDRHSGVSAEQARRFLDRALYADYSERHSPGAGYLLRIRDGVDGMALVWRDEAIHVGLFGERWQPVPRPTPPPIVPLPRPEPEPQPPSPPPPYPPWRLEDGNIWKDPEAR
jgi:hypothetical protein